MHSSRRGFLKAGAAVAGTALLGRSRRGWSAGEAPALRKPLGHFGHADVKLLDGPLRAQFDTNHAFYAALNEDSLLKPFRQKAGGAAPGEEMGGWYSWAPLGDLDKPGDNGFAPAHSFGQYVSGLARDYAQTGDKATQAKVHRLTRGLGEAITPRFWEDHRFPAYTYDKIAIGMLDAYELTGDAQALKVLDKTLDSVMKHLPERGLSRDEQAARPHRDESFCWDEPYTLPENFFIAWERGAGSRYKDLAVRFLADEWFWDPLAAGKNVLPGKHAYSHVNAMSSAAKAYLVLGSEKHLRAARNGFGFLQAQSFATGGWGPDESFREPGKGEIGESLTKTHSSFETPCGSYAHLKITRYLLRATGDSRYGDSMERVLFNCIAGAKPIAKDGHGFYYSDYNSDGAKVYHPYKWHCCTGTFAQVTADYGINSYLHDGEGIYVNLFVPSRVTWNRGTERATLTQRTEYPLRPFTEIEIGTEKSAVFPVYVRIPAWAGAGTRISVNGKVASAAPEPGKFARVERSWRNGDRIEIEFGMNTRLEAVDEQHANLQAAVHGPLTLFAVGAKPEGVRADELMSARQVSSGSSEWKTKNGLLTLRTFAAIGDEHYRLYQRITS